MKKRISKVLATVLTLALMASIVSGTGAGAKTAAAGIVKLADADAASGSSATASGSATGLDKVRGCLKDTVDYVHNLPESSSVTINGFLIKDAEGMAETYSMDLAKTYKGLKYVKPVFVDPNDAILITIAKGTMRVYDVNEQITREKLPPVVTVKNVKEIRKASKNSFTAKQVKGKKVSYITFKLNQKVKKQTTYTKAGKLFKKGKKKISAKAFKKYEKSYKKQKKYALTDGNPVDISSDLLAFYDYSNSAYYSKGLLWNNADFGHSSKTTVLKHDKDNTTDPFQAFYEDDGILTRYILPPNVINQKTGVSYQLEDWRRLAEEQMSFDWVVSGYYRIVGIGGDAENKVKFEEGETTTGIERTMSDGTKVKVTHYCVTINDEEEIGIEVYEDGKYAGKVACFASGSIMCPPTIVHVFTYDIPFDGQYIDPLASVYCYPQSDFSLEPTRSLTINYEGTDTAVKSWTVTAGNSVKFEFPWLYSGKPGTDSVQGGFYLKTDTGITKLPMEMADDRFYTFEGELNHNDSGVYSTVESVANSIYWAAE